MNKKVHTLFLTLTIVAGLSFLSENCLKTFETSPLDKKAKDFKFYARGIGLVKDGDLELVQFGQLP